MKKLFLFLLVALVSSQIVFGQTGESCATPNQKRTLSEAEVILLRSGTFYDNLRSAYADAINSQTGKYSISPDTAGMRKLIKNSSLMNAKEFIVPSEYSNGVRYGERVEFTLLSGQPSENWIVYKENQVDYPCGKIACMNPQKRKPVLRTVLGVVEGNTKTEQPVSPVVTEDREIRVVFSNYNYNYEKPSDLGSKKEEKHSNAFVKTLVKIVACAAGAYVGFKLYDLCKNQKSNNNSNNGGNNNDNGNNDNNGGGPGGSPLSSRLNPPSGFSLSF